MSKNLLASVVAVGLLAGPMAASASPVQWTVASGGNGHWYEFVAGAVNWSTAQGLAGSYFGGTGYLVNITSAAENAFILANMPTSWEGAWTGGREDINTANLFYWDSGPEANQTVGPYTNWASGEPNNNPCCSGSGPAGEDRIQILGWSNNSSPGTWNDLAQAGTLWHMSGYIVESPVPLPAAAWLLLSGLTGFGFVARRRTAA